MNAIPVADISQRFGTAESQISQLNERGTWLSGQIVFVVIACLLIIPAFLAPFGDFWSRSLTYDAYKDSKFVDPGTREGRLDKQVAIGIVGLFGLAALAWRGHKQLALNRPLGLVFAAYLVWCAATCFWSDDFGMSLR